MKLSILASLAFAFVSAAALADDAKDASCMTGESKAAESPLAAVAEARAKVPQGEKVTLEVTKMHCGSCAAKVRKKIRELSAAPDIVVDLDKFQASFTCNKLSCDVKRVVSDLSEMGYPSRLL